MKQKKALTDRRVPSWFVAAVVVFVMVLLTWAPGAQVLAAPPSQSPDKGKQLFDAKCAVCHTIGQGVALGPDLKGVTDRRDRNWLRQFISAPDQMLSQKDPIATDLLKQFNNIPMPNLALAQSDVEALIAYLESRAGEASSKVPAQVSTSPLPKGDSAIGKELFTGTTQLQNGGPPCMACHSIAGMGAFGGGALGPDLTATYGKLGDAMINWPETGTMRPLFATKSLTQEEKANLLAFFQSVSAGSSPAPAVGLLAGLGLAGAAGLLLLAQLLWRGRLGGVRKSLVARQLNR